MTDDRHITPPWSPEQVAALNAWQHNPWVHPFTCGRCRDELGTRFIRQSDGELRRETDEDFANLLALGPVELDPGHPMVARIVLTERELVATDDGWICRTCDYVQEWAWAFMADPRAARPIDA